MHVKIGHIIDILNVGGAERLTVDLVNALYHHGYDVSMIILVRPGSLEKEIHTDVKRYFLNRTNKYSLAKMRELSNTLNTFDIVHIHMRHVFRYVAIVKFLFPFKAKIIFHDHSSGIQKSYKNFVFKHLLHQVDFYISTSDELYHWTEDYLKISKNKTGKIVNTIFKQKTEKITLKERRNSKKTIKIIVVSNFRKEKNIQFILKLARILDSSTNIQLDIYGKKVDQIYYENMKKLLVRYKLSNCVKFITDCNNIQQKLDGYDMALHCAKKETGPLVLIEYISHGLPFLSYRTGEAVKTIDNYFPEMVINNFDYIDWKNRIVSILEIYGSENKRELLMMLYENKFSPKEYLKKCIKIYKYVLNY